MKNISFLLLFCFFSCKGKNVSKTNLNPEKKYYSNTAGSANNIVPLDSSYFLEKEISNKTSNIFLDKTFLSKVYAYSHLAYEDSGVLSQSDRVLLLCDSFSILHPRGSPKDRVELSVSQIKKLLRIINTPSNYQDGEAGCFFPRHTFIFVNAGNKICGIIEICFQCSQVYANPSFSYSVQKNGLLNREGMKALENFCNEIGIMTGI